MDADRDRFEALFRQHYGAAMRYAVRRVGREGADEVVAETFLVAWRRLDRVPDNALPWLLATARKVVANEVRRRERQLRLTDKAAAHTEPLSKDGTGLVDETLRLHAAMNALTERDREVLRLCAWEHLDTADAARALGCSTAAYKVRLHRARRRLAAYLAAPMSAESLVIEGNPS